VSRFYGSLFGIIWLNALLLSCYILLLWFLYDNILHTYLGLLLFNIRMLISKNKND